MCKTLPQSCKGMKAKPTSDFKVCEWRKKIQKIFDYLNESQGPNKQQSSIRIPFVHLFAYWMHSAYLLIIYLLIRLWELTAQLYTFKTSVSQSDIK